MREPFASRFDALRAEVTRRMAAHPECHGIDHIERVWHNAMAIAAAEGADEAVVTYAVWLHDLGRAAEFADAGQSCHAALGADMVPEVLAAIGIDDPDFAEHVAACVRTHRYRSRDGQAPETLEAKILYDADKLDSIGAIGIGRAFHFAGGIRARVHNAAAEARAGETYGREDTAYREFLVKLQHIHDNLLTAEGRRLGERRHAFMVRFFDEITDETGVA